MKIQYHTINGLWYWRLIAKNKATIAVGGEGFDSKSNVKRACTKLSKYFIEPPLIEEHAETPAP